MAQRRKWTSEEEDVLRANYGELGQVGDWSELLPGRSRQSIGSRAFKLGLKSNGRKWTEEEDAQVRRWYPEMGPGWEGWSKFLRGRTYKSITKRACELGVRCKYRGPKSWTKSEDQVAVLALQSVCNTTHRSPTAVIHRLAWLYRRAQQTS